MFSPDFSTPFQSGLQNCSFLKKKFPLLHFLCLPTGADGVDNKLVGKKCTSQKEALSAISRSQHLSVRTTKITIICTLLVIFNKPLPTKTFYFLCSPYNHVLLNRNYFLKIWNDLQNKPVLIIMYFYWSHFEIPKRLLF